MSLITQADLTFYSPLAGALQNQPTAPLAAAQAEVGLADLSGRALTSIRSQAAAEVASNAYGVSVPEVGGVVAFSEGLLARPRPDTILALGPGAPTPPEGSALVTVTDVTHGYGQILLVGQHAPHVLPKVCGLDFDESVFPNNRMAISSLAKARTHIIRADDGGVPAYHLLVGYSLAAYVWGVVLDAASEFNGVVTQI